MKYIIKQVKFRSPNSTNVELIIEQIPTNTFEKLFRANKKNKLIRIVQNTIYLRQRVRDYKKIKAYNFSFKHTNLPVYQDTQLGQFITYTLKTADYIISINKTKKRDTPQYIDIRRVPKSMFHKTPSPGCNCFRTGSDFSI